MCIELITTKNGNIRGNHHNGYTIYKGIPYAKPPIGPLRFKPPIPIGTWDTPYSATQYKDASLQEFSDPDGMYTKEFYQHPAFDAPSSEDCLYLNVFTPAANPKDSLPVVIWIHGGGFEHGYSYESEFDGEAYCKQGIIFVSISYRVGVLGFLCHEFLKDENGRMGNYGILDQIAAINWIKDNISSFGGDPERISIMGQSAGAISTQILCSSPLSKNNFKRAIMQSGGRYKLGLHLDFSLSHALNIGNLFASLTNVKSKEDFYTLSCSTILKATATIIKYADKNKLPLPFSPVIDKYILFEDLDHCIDNNTISDIPYLLGSTANDLGTSQHSKYQGEKGNLFNSAVSFALKREQTGKNPVFVYYFNHPLPGSNDGAFHSSELWYTFGTLSRCWRPFTDYDHQLSKQMISYWCNFIKHGEPCSYDTVTWKEYKSNSPFYMEFR